LRPEETEALLDAGIGVTNLVARATARADELERHEIAAGRHEWPRWPSGTRRASSPVLGLTTWRTATGDRTATVGPQQARLGGRPVWLLPNPSGLNAGWPLPGSSRPTPPWRATASAPSRLPPALAQADRPTISAIPTTKSAQPARLIQLMMRAALMMPRPLRAPLDAAMLRSALELRNERDDRGNRRAEHHEAMESRSAQTAVVSSSLWGVAVAGLP
jgi:hypothetical protein